MLGFCADLLDLPFAGAPCKLLMDSSEGASVENRRVIVLYVVFRPLTVMDFDLLGSAVLSVGKESTA